jgi:hypothetical protein
MSEKVEVTLARLEGKLEAHNDNMTQMLREIKDGMKGHDKRLRDVEKQQEGLHVKLHGAGAVIALLVSGATTFLFRQ